MRKIIAPFLIITLLFGSLAGCSKKQTGESDSDFAKRQRAIYTAQAARSIEGWSDVVDVLERGGKLSATAANTHYAVNDRVLSGLDVVADRLQAGLTGDALTKVKELIADVGKLQDVGAIGITDPEAIAKFNSVLFTIQFTLESIRAIIEAKTEPEIPAETKALLAESRGYRQKGRALTWYEEVILTVQTVATDLFAISRLTTADSAWAKYKEVSAGTHAKNAQRKG